MNLNKALIIGNLTRDPELRTLPNGTSVASFGVATNRVWKNPQGAKQEDVQFHNIVVFGRQAETVSQYLTKGSLVYVEGRLQTRSWDAKDGSKQSRTEIVAERVQFGPRGAGSSSQAGGASSPQGGGSRNGPTPRAAGREDAPPLDDLPAIDLGDEDVKAEDLPF